jgi:hypothetical protein
MVENLAHRVADIGKFASLLLENAIPPAMMFKVRKTSDECSRLGVRIYGD